MRGLWKAPAGTFAPSELPWGLLWRKPPLCRLFEPPAGASAASGGNLSAPRSRGRLAAPQPSRALAQLRAAPRRPFHLRSDARRFPSITGLHGDGGGCFPEAARLHTRGGRPVICLLLPIISSSPKVRFGESSSPIVAMVTLRSCCVFIPTDGQKSAPNISALISSAEDGAPPAPPLP